MLDAGGAYIRTGGGKVEFLIVQGGAAVLDIELCDDKVNTRFFEFAVGKAVCTKKLGSAHLKPYGIDGVVDDAGLVGFTVPWDDGYRMAVNCSFFGKFHIFFSNQVI